MSEVQSRFRPGRLLSMVGLGLSSQIGATSLAKTLNLRNLFELPVLFYALCLLLMQQGLAQPVEVLDVQLAWAFVGFRALHSLVQCTVNIVNARFAFYALSSIALWVMLARACLRLWA